MRRHSGAKASEVFQTLFRHDVLGGARLSIGSVQRLVMICMYEHVGYISALVRIAKRLTRKQKGFNKNQCHAAGHDRSAPEIMVMHLGHENVVSNNKDNFGPIYMYKTIYTVMNTMSCMLIRCILLDAMYYESNIIACKRRQSL